MVVEMWVTLCHIVPPPYFQTLSHCQSRDSVTSLQTLILLLKQSSQWIWLKMPIIVRIIHLFLILLWLLIIWPCLWSSCYKFSLLAYLTKEMLKCSIVINRQLLLTVKLIRKLLTRQWYIVTHWCFLSAVLCLKYTKWPAFWSLIFLMLKQ